MIGQELIGFKYMHQVEEDLYKISCLTRGLIGTEQYITSHAPGENCVFIEYGLNILAISEKVEDQKLDFKCGNSHTSLVYRNIAQKPLAPYITKQSLSGTNLYLSWVFRARDDGNWKFQETKTEDQKYEFSIIVTAANQHITSTADNKCEIIIDLSTLDLSEGYNINIIPKQ
jgi:hypothetical protein